MSEKKQPWLKFFPADWRADPALRVCSIAARGIWIEMLCLMHEADPRGFLKIGDRSVTLPQLAGLVGSPLRAVQTLVEELESNGVFSRDSDGVIFSRRIRRDVEKAARDKANGQTGGNPSINTKDNEGVNPPDKAQKPEARNQSPEVSLRETRSREALAAFEDLWSAYPRRSGHNPKKPARDKFVRLVQAGVDPQEILAGVGSYARSRAGQDPQFTKQMLVFLNQEGWKDDHRPPDPFPRAGPRSDGMKEFTRHLDQIIEHEQSQHHQGSNGREARAPNAGATSLFDDSDERHRGDAGGQVLRLTGTSPYGRR